MQNNQNQQPSIGSAIGRVAIDMLKITVAVAGGIAVYKLAENYLSGSDTPCIGCGGGAVPEIGTGGTYVTTSADAAAFTAMERVDSAF